MRGVRGEGVREATHNKQDTATIVCDVHVDTIYTQFPTQSAYTTELQIEPSNSKLLVSSNLQANGH